MFFKKQNKNEFIKWGIAGGFLECVYVFLVILLFNIISNNNSKINEFMTGGLFMLLLFVVSVLVSGMLVFGKPVRLVLDKKISQAINTFFVTLVTIFIIFVIVGIVLFV
ncbi:hypothetical protein KKA66_00430 [Patescibacteria group bacterium]|nr:hypothetical protein [Patescibacteria group bacterium]